MKEKQIYIINAKLEFENMYEVIPFFVEADNNKQAENKLYNWLKDGKSDYKFTRIIFIWTEKIIYVIN